MNTFGHFFRFTIFGQSHAKAVGVTMEGLPSGFSPDMEKLQTFLNRRAPGRSGLSTPRREADRPEFISGLVEGKTCGAPVTAVIYNTNTKSSDYEELRYIPRPGHADYTAMVKYGDARDFAGGGQFSGRLTAPLCIAGALAKQLLEAAGVKISARAAAIGGEESGEGRVRAIEDAKNRGDSVGGIIECACDGVPAGIGEPMFGGMENRISQAVFGIPAVKGIEFGNGFSCASLFGSENNDEFMVENGRVITVTNRHGGILGGITSGMPIVFRVAVKPTPSIAKEQRSVDLREMKDVSISVKGRHDPCIVPRAVSCVEAAAAVAIYDALLEQKALEWHLPSEKTGL